MEDFSAVNWIAVFAGAVVSFLMGWLWYSPKLFGIKWAEGSRVTLGSAESMPVFAMLAQIVALFLLASLVGLTATTDSLITAILAIITAALFVTSCGAFVRKSGYALSVDFFFIIIAGVIMIAFQGIFRHSGIG